MVTKHADILEVSNDNTVFPYGDYPSTLAPHVAVEHGREAKAAGPAAALHAGADG